MVTYNLISRRLQISARGGSQDRTNVQDPTLNWQTIHCVPEFADILPFQYMHTACNDPCTRPAAKNGMPQMCQTRRRDLPRQLLCPLTMRLDRRLLCPLTMNASQWPVATNYKNARPLSARALHVRPRLRRTPFHDLLPLLPPTSLGRPSCVILVAPQILESPPVVRANGIKRRRGCKCSDSHRRHWRRG